MWQTVSKFADGISLPLSQAQAQTLTDYAQLVWQKKNMLNLTSAADLTEILQRHICDGLQGAAWVQAWAQRKARQTFDVIDAGSGAGYIGVTWAIALPHIHVTLVESLEKRCAFLNWAILKLNLKNISVKNVRLGEQKALQADVVTERAMGQLPDILSICLQAVKPEGVFVAYQGENALPVEAAKYGAAQPHIQTYTLPSDNKNRQLVCFEKISV